MKKILIVALAIFAASTVYAEKQKVITTDTGLQYIDQKVGDGAEAISGKEVVVHYTGWLKTETGDKGTQFDSSVKRGDPFKFPLGAGMVIRGWDEGVQGMKIGGKRQLIIPSKLAYGSRGAGKLIPPDSDLIFDVELLEVREKKNDG